MGSWRPAFHFSSQTLTRCSACLIFLAVSLAVTALGRDQRSGFTLITSPTTRDHGDNSLLGYSFLHGDQPYMKENIAHAAQVGTFSGAWDAMKLSASVEPFRLIRGLYSFLASLFTPLCGVIGAMLLVNWLCWALCAWVAWRLTLDLSKSELAAAVAVALVAGGIGMTIHIGDYSPHLLAHAIYYLGALLLYRSEVYCRPQSWMTHARLAVYMAIACLGYNTGTMLVGVYLLISLRHNRLIHVLPAAAFALAARPIWQLLMRLGSDDVEAQYLMAAVKFWSGIFSSPVLVLKVAALRFFELLAFFDSPLVVIAGIVCCWVVPLDRSRRWFGACVMGVPLLSAWVFSATASARGYLIYGITVWVFACLAWQIAHMLERPERGRRVAALVAVLFMLGAHFAWSTAHLWHYLGPGKTYFLGAFLGWPALASPPTEAMSMTGCEPTPILFGGLAGLADAGALVTTDHYPLSSEGVSFSLAYTARAWFFVYLGLLALLTSTRLRRMVGVSLAILALAVTSWISSQTLRSLPAFLDVDNAVYVAPQGTLRYRTALSDEFLHALKEKASEGDRLAIYLLCPELASVKAKVTTGRTILPAVVDRRLLVLRGPAVGAALDAMANSREITVELFNPTADALSLGGWQRGSLPSRTCTIQAPEAPSPQRAATLPVLEVRLVNRYGKIKLAGF